MLGTQLTSARGSQNIVPRLKRETNGRRVSLVLSYLGERVHERVFIESSTHVATEVLMLSESIIMVLIDSLALDISHNIHPAGCVIRLRELQRQLGLESRRHQGLNRSISVIGTAECGLRRAQPRTCDHCSNWFAHGAYSTIIGVLQCSSE